MFRLFGACFMLEFASDFHKTNWTAFGCEVLRHLKASIRHTRSHRCPESKSGWMKWIETLSCRVCNLQPLGASDYLEMSRLFDTIFIRHIPLLTLNKKTQARRLITLVDTLYDHKVSARRRRPQTSAPWWGLLLFMTTTSSRCRWGWWSLQIIRWRTFSRTMGISVTMRATSWWTIWGWKGWELPRHFQMLAVAELVW